MEPLEADSVMSLVKARSMLLILLGTCDQTLVALQAAANVLDTGLTEDLSRMIDRTHAELKELDRKLGVHRAE